MAYFSSLGYFLEPSGAGNILCASGVLAPGSTNGFMSGKHFKRYKRIHILLAIAMQILHFWSFVHCNGPISIEFMNLPKLIAEQPNQHTLCEMFIKQHSRALMDKYYVFKKLQSSSLINFKIPDDTYWHGWTFTDYLIDLAVQTMLTFSSLLLAKFIQYLLLLT